MKTKIKIVVGIVILFFFLIPISTQFVAAQNEQIKVKEGTDAITITTDHLTMKIKEGKPHFIWWNGNQSSADEMYNVQYTTLEEFFGEDTVLDNLSELNGLSYNLLTSNWAIDIIEEETEVTVTMSLTGLANGAEMQFIVHIYNQDQPLPGTDQIVDGLTEVKVDIIIKNWVFSANAQGIALKAQILESQKRHQVRIRNGTGEENGNKTRTMQFESEKHGNAKVAYYEWATFASVYDGDVKLSEIEVGTSYLSDSNPGMGQGPGLDDPGMIQQWLTYPKYGDSLTMVHDPSIGVNPESFTVPLYLLPILGGIIATTLFVVIKKRRD